MTVSERLPTTKLQFLTIFDDILISGSYLYCDKNLMPKSTATSVTRLGDLLDFGNFLKAFGNN